MLKVLRHFVEEEDAEELKYEKQQTLFGTFEIFKTVVGTIQPDKEGHLWDEIRDSINVFNSPDRQNLKKLLTQYKDMLVARAELMKRNEVLRKQNAEMKQLLKNVI